MLNHFTFNGHSTAEYGLLVTALNPYSAPSRRIEKVEIPYRNGDLVIDSGVYNNIIVSYEVSVINNTKDNFEALRNWLLTSQGYHQLSDTINTDSFRVGCYYQSVDATLTALYKYGKAVISFDCFPQRYLTTNTPITTTATADTTTDTTLSLSTVPTPITISLNGNTTQEGSSGKNVFDYTTVTNTGIVDDSGTVGTYQTRLWSAKIGVSPSTTYTFKTTAYSSNNERIYINRLIYYAQDGTFLRRNADYNTLSEATFTTPSDVYFLVIDLRTQRLTTNLTNTLLKGNTQLEKGSTATAYEPHISPTNPQTIHNVSGDNIVQISGNNIIAGEFMADKLVKEVANSNACYKTEDEHGKCLLFTSSNDIRNGVILDTFKPNTQYTVIGREQNATTTGSGANIIVSYTDGSYEFIFLSSSGVTTGTVYDWTFTTASGKSVKTISLYNHHSGNRKLYYEHFGIFEGANASFEPYTRQSYPIYLPVENLINFINSRTANGVTFTYNAETGGVNVNGTASPSNAYSDTTISRATASNYVYVQRGTYTASLGVNNGAVKLYVQAWYDNGTSAILVDTLYEKTFTITQSAWIYTRLRVTAGDTADNVTVYPQLEKGEKANHFTKNGTTPIELNKIGTYQDYIYKNGGKWYVHKAIGKSIINDIPWVYSSGSALFYATLANMTPAGLSRSDALCSTYPFNSGDDKFIATTSTQLRLIDSSYTDVTSLKSAMGDVEIYYQLATPTNTEITDTTLINQLNNIEKAYSYNGTTNILQVSNDNGFMLSVVSLHSNNVSSNYKGEPIITVNSTGLIYFNGCVIKVNQAPMTINSQTMQAYNGTVNLNNYIEANDFPMIEPGNNVIGSEMPLSIVPNYWKL